MTDERRLLNALVAEPLGYPDLEPHVDRIDTVINRACRDGLAFYVYDVLRLIRDRVWGMIGWVAKESYDVKSSSEAYQLFDSLSVDGQERLRQKLCDITTAPQYYKEHPYRLVVRSDQASQVRTKLPRIFAAEGRVFLLPGNGDDWLRWYRQPDIPIDWESATASEQEYVRTKVQVLQQLMPSAKTKNPFAFYVLRSRKALCLRFYHVPPSAEVLVLQAANVARLALEYGRVEEASRAKDLRAALLPWLTPEKQASP